MKDNKDKDASFPQQQLPFSKKGAAWRRRCVDWAVNRTYYNYEPVRKSVQHKKINYDLVNGKLHLEDIKKVIEPDMRHAGFKPESIQHYAVINRKMELLEGEEHKRVFDHTFVVTNPNGVSEVERRKRDEVRRKYEEYLGGDQNQNAQQDAAQMQRLNDFMAREYQDEREQRANYLVNHYDKEQNFPLIFNQGFKDAMISGEEVYICDIVCDEPVLTRLNPMDVHVFRSGYSNRIEDADVVVIESYWSVGRIIDWFHESLTAADIKKLESRTSDGDGTDDDDIEAGFIEKAFAPGFSPDENIEPGENPADVFGTYDTALSPYDTAGNVRVIRVFWKSRKKILKVKSYDPETGEEVYNIYPEDHVINEDMGEEATELWVNEAWEGTKIGADIYVDIRPRRVQYNSLSNPSRCHFGIVGTIYNVNGSKPFSFVDRMKPFNYLYDIIHDRLNKLIARNWGMVMKLDLAMIPDGWDVEKFLYFAKENGIAVTDSFKEGNSGAAMGKVAGALNNNSNGVINLDDSAAIRNNIELLAFIDQEMSKVVGISDQREGEISNRETVGGVERATIQSAHITEWLFAAHDDTKRRVYECFVETAKAALRGNSKKFQYILSDGSSVLVSIDGDEFAECDYGIVCDYSNDAQRLKQSIETLAQAALQNQLLDFSTVLKLYNSTSLSEKQRLVENAERTAKEQAQQAQQSQQDQVMQQEQLRQQGEQLRMQHEKELKQMDIEGRIRVAEIEAQGRLEAAAAQSMYKNEDSESDDRRREFDAKMDIERQKLDIQREKIRTDAALKKRVSDDKNRTDWSRERMKMSQSDIENRREEMNKMLMNERDLAEQARDRRASNNDSE